MIIKHTDLRTDVLAYKIIEKSIYVNYEDKVYKLDFSSLPDGKISKIDVDFLVDAQKKDDELYITLRKPVDQDGNKIPQDDFLIDEYEEIEIIWKSQEEIEEEKLLENLIPTQEEIADAELEIKTITLLIELEVI